LLEVLTTLTGWSNNPTTRIIFQWFQIV
jgi:hypothetical protein